jgi:hypothetical protein
MAIEKIKPEMINANPVIGVIGEVPGVFAA